MREQKQYAGLAARLLSGAREFIWQEDLPARREATAVQAPATAAPASTQRSAPSALDGLAAELMSVVMSRPTAYSALADAIAALSAVPMDESTRFASAFAVLQKTQQRTVEQIAQAIDVHLSVLESEKTRFGAQSASAEAEEVASRLQQAQSLAAASAEADKRIAALRAETEEQVRKIEEDKRLMQERAAELSREAESKRQAIAQRVAEFTASAKVVETALLSDKSKLQQYLV